jgi:hypothetical protein
MAILRRNKKEGFFDYIARLVEENPTPQVELSPDQEGFWATFVSEFASSNEWHTAMTRLIDFWREIDTDTYPMYAPLQELSDWELAYATEVMVINDFALTYVQFGLIDGINPVLKPAAREFLAGYFVAMACKMDQLDIEGFIKVLKSQIEDFGIDNLKSEGAASRFN